VARDRQRAKLRKQRQAPQQPSRDRNRDQDEALPEEPLEGQPGEEQPLEEHLHRANVPPAWQHGGEVDEVEAAIVAGADGEPEEDPDAAARAAFGDDGDDDGGGLPPVEDGAPDDPAGVPAPRAGGEHAAVGGRGGGRFWNFLKASWAELQRVQWPDRRQVGQATAVVLGFVLIAGAFLGFADYVASEIVDLII
jgi:preprotein translocase SecE subunit